MAAKIIELDKTFCNKQREFVKIEPKIKECTLNKNIFCTFQLPFGSTLMFCTKKDTEDAPIIKEDKKE